MIGGIDRRSAAAVENALIFSLHVLSANTVFCTVDLLYNSLKKIKKNANVFLPNSDD